jgi:hypothetical protein
MRKKNLNRPAQRACSLSRIRRRLNLAGPAFVLFFYLSGFLTAWLVRDIIERGYIIPPGELRPWEKPQPGFQPRVPVPGSLR